uniref:Uncharacterized protein n=1 Tax=Globodera rostochiensis TaxID=31243 RepID=A0A914I7F3_GLORO
MTIGSNICDPDELLAKEDRQKLNGALEELENVGQGTGSSSCTKKGLTAMLAIADHIDTTGHDAVKKMADGLMRRWNLDSQCKKAIVILVAIGDRKFWTSRKNGTSIVGTEFTQMFNDQKNLFRSALFAFFSTTSECAGELAQHVVVFAAAAGIFGHRFVIARLVLRFRQLGFKQRADFLFGIFTHFLNRKVPDPLGPCRYAFLALVLQTPPWGPSIVARLLAVHVQPQHVQAGYRHINATILATISKSIDTTLFNIFASVGLTLPGSLAILSTNHHRMAAKFEQQEFAFLHRSFQIK